MKKRPAPEPRQPARFAEPAPGRRRGWRIAAIAIGTLAAMGLAIGGWISRPNRPPAVDLSRATSAVRRTIEGHLADVRHHPRSATAWGQLGAVLYAYQLLPEARIALVEAARRDPANPRWPYLHGISVQADDPTLALELFRRAVARCGNEPPAPRLRLARTLGEQGHWPEVEHELGLLFAVHPDEPHGLLLAAQASQARSDLGRAVEFARRASKSPVAARPALALLSSLLSRQGDPQGAADAARLAASAPGGDLLIDPFDAEARALRDDPSALNERVHPLMARGRLTEAGEVVARMREEYPEFPDTWLAAGRLEILLKNPAAAEEHLRHHLQLDSSSIQGWFQLGFAHLSRQRNVEAIEAFGRAVGLKPDFGPAWFNLGVALGRVGRREEAVQAFRQTLRHNPEHLETYLLFADLHLQTGQKAPALALLDQAAQLSPDDRRLAALRRKAAALR